ncbi:hypothetical protein [Nostoc sp.]
MNKIPVTVITEFLGAGKTTKIRTGATVASVITVVDCEEMNATIQ